MTFPGNGALNSTLIAEMRAIDFVKRLLADGKLDPARYTDVLMHRIDGGNALNGYSASSKSATDSKLIHGLQDLGHTGAAQWLQKKSAQVGISFSIQIANDYLDDLREPVAHSVANGN